MLGHLAERNGRLYDQHYLSPVPTLRSVKFTYEGQTVPPMVLVKPGEVARFLSFYEVNIHLWESERYRDRYSDSLSGFMALAQSPQRRNLKYLENYLLVLKPNGKMIMIADDHTHAAYGFGLARRMQVLRDDAELFHVDEHKDNFTDRGVEKLFAENPSLYTLSQYCKTRLEIDSYLAYACRAGYFKPSNINYILTENLGRTEAPPYQPAGNTLKEGKMLLLEQVPEKMRKVIARGGSAILNLDFDILAYRHEPIFPEKKKAELAGVGEEWVMGHLMETAKIADFIFIATSPDYFNVSKATVVRLIKAIVDAA